MLNVGLGSDYVIHVLLRYRELAAAGHATPAALVETVRGVGSSLVLCAVTTAAGFYCVHSDDVLGRVRARPDRRHRRVLRPVRQRDAAAGARRVVGRRAAETQRGDVARPAHLRAVEPPTAARARRDGRGARRGARRVAARHVRQQPDPLARSATASRSRRCSSSPRPARRRCSNLVAVAPDRATALGWADGAAQLPEVRSVTTTDSLVPREQDEKLALLEDLALLHGPAISPSSSARRPTRARWRPRSRSSKPRARAAPAARALHDAVAACASSSRAAGDGERAATLRRLDEALTAGLAARARASCARRSRAQAVRSRRSAGAARRALARERRPRARRDHAGRGRQRQRGRARVSSPPCTPSCRRRRACPSSTKRRRRRSWRRSSARCCTRSSW